jgi:cytochrome oxidase Cu insertion factor (SCO1/SenC/PrrC family)
VLLRNRHSPWVRLAFMIGAVGLFAVGYYWGNLYKLRNQGPPVIQGVLLRPPLELPAFELQDADGRRLTAAALAERWTLLAFGDLSRARGHLAVNRLIDVFNRLADRPELRAKIQLALVAEDPPLDLARDFARLSPALRVLSGDAQALADLRSALGEDGGEDAPFYLIGPHGRARALFTPTQAPAAIAEDLAALAERPDDAEPDTTK